MGFVRYEVPRDHALFGRVSPCQCNQPAIDAACGLNADERKLTLAQVKTNGRAGAQRMKAAAAEFLKEKTGMLSLCGSWGNGKSLVLMAIVNECLRAGIEARYITATEMMLWIQEAFDPKVIETDKARIERLARVPVLCIDELDKIVGKEYSDRVQQHIINARYRYNTSLGTVLAWNGDEHALRKGDIHSRASEFIIIENKDADLRPLMGQARAKKAGIV